MKREDEALQKIANRLIALSTTDLETLGLSPELLEAVIFAASRPKRGSLRREALHVGALLRNEADVELVEARLALVEIRLLEEKRSAAPSKPASAQSESAEEETVLLSPRAQKWQNALLSGDSKILGTIRDVSDSVDLSRLRQLVRNAEKGKGVRPSERLAAYLHEIDGGIEGEVD